MGHSGLGLGGEAWGREGPPGCSPTRPVLSEERLRPTGRHRVGKQEEEAERQAQDHRLHCHLQPPPAGTASPLSADHVTLTPRGASDPDLTDRVKVTAIGRQPPAPGLTALQLPPSGGERTQGPWLPVVLPDSTRWPCPGGSVSILLTHC